MTTFEVKQRVKINQPKAKSLHGRTGTIITHDPNTVCNWEWRVQFTDGDTMWFDADELEPIDSPEGQAVEFDIDNLSDYEEAALYLMKDVIASVATDDQTRQVFECLVKRGFARPYPLLTNGYRIMDAGRNYLRGAEVNNEAYTLLNRLGIIS